MRLLSAAAVLLGTLASAQASVPPERIELTPEIQTRYGFEVSVTENSGDLILELRYPESLESAWLASGSVTWLVVGGDEDSPLLASRTDFSRTDGHRTIFAAIPVDPKSNDLYVDIVYLCAVDGETCRRGTLVHYGVSGIRKLYDVE